MNVLEARHLSKRYGTSTHIALNDVSLDVGRGEVLAVVGESGSGKTTLLRLIAGLEIPTDGEVLLNGHVASSARGCVPPERRGVGIVFQDYALFPHLTVLENVAFGLQTLRRKQQRERALQALSLVGLLEYGGRYPHELSGGQQQRVALARAMAPQPALLLLDEPFSNLDVMLKEQVREEVGEILRKAGTTAIFVVHDLDDVLSVADRIAILRDGRLQQIDTPAEVYRKPADEYVARLFGTTSLLPATPGEGGFETRVGFVPSAAARDLSGPVVLSVRPEDVVVGSANGGATATVRQVRYRGSHNELVLALAGTPELTLIARVAADRSPVTGDAVSVCIAPDGVRILG
ncbi:MAG TPA: ABC transporter ATP-binding protein [Longimicrobiales bacterium]|nr:ABC transporter ATP-binding protein [Longimicrobiales bacterium]